MYICSVQDQGRCQQWLPLQRKRPKDRGWALEKEPADQAARPPAEPPLEGFAEESALATKLLQLWSLGSLPASTITQLAHLAILDGASHPELAALANCGGFGDDPGKNAHRGVMRLFCKDIDLPEPVDVQTRAVDPKSSLEEDVFASVFLPHIMFASLAGYAVQFAKLFSTQHLHAFWDACEKTGHDRLRGHPMKKKRDWKQKTISIFLHADGVEYHERDSMMVWSWGSVFSLLSSLDCHILMSLFPKSCTAATTWEPIMKLLCWSLKALSEGMHPKVDQDGSPFAAESPFYEMRGLPLVAGNYRCVIWAIQGDHEFFSNVLKLPHWANHRPCWECDCDVTIPSKTFRVIEPSLQQWIPVDTKEAMANPRSSHEVFSIPGATTRMVRGDGLHIMFTKGVYAHLMGSMLHILCWAEGPGKVQRVAPAKRLAIIFEQVQLAYANHQSTTRVTNLRLSMFTKEKEPHASHAFLNTKGSESKHLAPAFLDVCKQICDQSNPVHAHMISALECITEVVALFDQAPIVLSPEEFQKATNLGECFLKDYAWLNKWACDNNRQLFHIVMKFHTFWHLIQNSKFCNPRFHWCFKSEDFVGRMSRLSHSVSMGTKSTKISQKVTPKYRILFHLRLTRQGFEELDV